MRLHCKYYYRARYYDPGTGRFLNEDPIGIIGLDLNLYRYTKNKPVNRVDPTGLYSSSGNSCETIALNTYFQQLDFGIEYCEQELKKAMDICDVKARKKMGEQLTPDEAAIEQAVKDEMMKEHKKQGKKNLKKMRDEAMRGF